MKSRKLRDVTRLIDDSSATLGHMAGGLSSPSVKTPRPRSKGNTLTQSHLKDAERGNPDGVPNMGKPTVRNAELSSGRRKSREAKAASRKATGNHNWADRAATAEIPNPWRAKDADARLVNLLKTRGNDSAPKGR